MRKWRRIFARNSARNKFAYQSGREIQTQSELASRREFMTNSAKFALAGVALGAFAGVSPLFAANSNANSGAKNASGANLNKNAANSKAQNSNKGVTMQFTTLNNGAKMPLVGFGTWLIRGAECQKAVENALKVGYRLIDTAQMYGNENEVGSAIKASGLKASELFITTKLSHDMSYSTALREIESSLKRLGLDYVDLMLIHKPYSHYKDMYKAMEKLCKDGRIKAVGLSNFKPQVFNELIKSCEIVPAVNQMETHLFFQQKELRALMQKHGTKLEAWSPFAKGREDFFTNKTLVSVAKKHGKTPAQVALRFLIEQDIIVIPKTTRVERMRENIAIFDFALDESDKKALNALDGNEDFFRWF